ncbi:MAG TPA: DUF4440 domain-containing protein [Vicinamibacterales bacterium]|nr:DUF4440 domain-containing protein [Vicinamibacterales bacterium]
MKTRYACLIFALALVPGCRADVDVEAERELLRQTDLEWAATAAAGQDLERIVSYWTDDAKVYPAGMPVVDGKAAILEFVAGTLATPGFVVTWQPQEVVVSPDGRFGYTIGANQFTAPDPSGVAVTTHGRYVTVWRKEPDGAWRCVIDIWNTR